MAERTFTRSVMELRCPRCREGKLFTKDGFFVFNGMSAMPANCPVCGLRYDREPGFFWGAMYISYGIAVAIILPVFIIAFALVKLTFWQSVGAGSIALLILVPFVFRISRSLWIHMFVSYKDKA